MTDGDTDIDDLRDRRPGSDEDDPYADVDVSALPAWWQRAIEHFERHDLRPYRPPRFEDGTAKHEVEAILEAELDAEIAFTCVNASVGDEWTVRVDGEPIGTIGRHRSPDGYTVFEMAATEFVAWVRDATD